MVGLPCSGKSTWIKKQKFNGNIISFDNYLTEKFDKNYNKAWSKYQALNASDKTNILDIILRRNNERKDKFIPVDVLDAMRSKYEEPNIDEGFDRVVFRAS